MNNKVVTFGEIMLRLSPPSYQRICQASTFDVVYGGGEANVAVSLANFGLEANFVTKLPKNALGEAALQHLRKYGVETGFISRGGGRLGIYFLETGASQRPSQVVYDRAESSIAKASTQDFDWDIIFENTSWFHVTGITPALSDSAFEITLQACRKAKNKGITVSCDLNYREKLWPQEKARAILGKIMNYVDIAIGNEEDADKVFGIKAKLSDVNNGVINEDGYREVVRKLVQKFDLKAAALTLRKSYSASDNGWSGLLYDGNNYFHSRDYEIRVVDRIGSGDSFASGLIYGYMSKLSPQDTIEFATAASCLKHTVLGDFNVVWVDEVKSLIGGDASGRVKR